MIMFPVLQQLRRAKSCTVASAEEWFSVRRVARTKAQSVVRGSQNDNTFTLSVSARGTVGGFGIPYHTASHVASEDLMDTVSGTAYSFEAIEITQGQCLG